MPEEFWAWLVATLAAYAGLHCALSPHCAPLISTKHALLAGPATQPSQTQPEAEDDDGTSDEDDMEEGPSQVTPILQHNWTGPACVASIASLHSRGLMCIALH